jgi:glycosyltransferase involved in cell wall biosynthesis
MHILHLYKDYFPVLGGIENHIKLLAEAQAAQGHQVSVLVTSQDRSSHVEMVNGVQVSYAGRLATISSTPVSFALSVLLSQSRPEVVHLHFPYPWGEAANSFFGHAHKTVLTYHSDIVRQRYLRLVYAPLMNRMLGQVDTIIATSPNYVATSPVLARWRKKCVVVPLGIDPTPYLAHPTLSPPAHVRDPRSGAEGSGTTRDGNGTLLFVGRLRYYKGVDDLLRAVVDLPGTRLVIVGTGPMKEKWEYLARDLGVEQRVKFMGEVAQANLTAYYNDCDVFVLPCSERSEAFGVVQLEAMAAGKPVVSCDVGTGVTWVNQNDVTGLVVPPHSPQALAIAIRRILGDERLAAEMGAAGRKRVKEEFTAKKMVERVMEVYERGKAFDLCAI